jgi:hypothetical protein
MKRTTRWLATLLVAGGAALAGTNQAKADLLESTTSSYFSESSGSASLSNNNQTLKIGSGSSAFTITFAGIQQSASVSGQIQLGTFTVSGSGSFYGTSIPSDTEFHLKINQTNPSSGTGTNVADVNGSLGWFNDTLRLTFTSGSVTVGSPAANAVTYNLVLGSNKTFDLSNDSQTLYANVVLPAAVATPEPSTLSIAAIGALAACGYGLRRRKQNAA